MDDIPLSEFSALRDAAAASLTELVARWPSNVLEEVGAPGQLREFLLAATGPMEATRAVCTSSQTTLLREYDAVHAELTLLRSKLAGVRQEVEALAAQSQGLRSEARKSRDTLGVTVDRMRGQLAEHARRVAEYEGVTWTGSAGDVQRVLGGSGGSGALSSSPLPSASPTRTLAPGGGLTRLVTTSELIALACVPNDESVGRARRLENAKARAAAQASASPVAVYKELLEGVKAEAEGRVREVAEAGAARLAQESGSGDVVYEAGLRDAQEAAQEAAQAEAARMQAAEGSGGRQLGALVLSTPLPERCGLRQRLEVKTADIERCREEQRRLSGALAAVDTDLTALHVRHHCSTELANLKSYCRAVWNLNTAALPPLSRQRFLLATLSLAPFSGTLHTFLQARHPPLASRYTLGPALASPPPYAGGEGGREWEGFRAQQAASQAHQQQLYAEALGLGTHQALLQQSQLQQEMYARQ